MNVQSFLFAHGEKLLLGLVVLICALALYGTIANEETRSTTTLAEINEVVAKLDRAYQTPGRPNLAPTRAFEEEIKTRFQLQVDAQPLVVGLTTKLDVSRGDDVGGVRRIYAYEIVTPEVRIEDVVGSLIVRVSVPTGPRPDAPDDYIADAAGGVSWTRQEPKRGDVTNVAQHAGVLLEYRIFRNGMGVDEGWQPIISDDAPGGVLPLSGGAGQATMHNVEPWQTYDVRARVLVAATGTVSRADGDWKIGKEVALFKRALPVSPPPRNWNQAKEVLEIPFEAGEFDKLLAERYTGPKPTGPGLAIPSARRQPMHPGLVPDGGMSGRGGTNPASIAADLPIDYFLGAPSELASIQTKASVYLGLKRASGGIPGIPANATIVAKRLLKDADGTVEGWTDLVEYKVQEGEAVGGQELMKKPGGDLTVPIDLSTPFVVQKIEKDVKRIWYYEVREKSVPTPDGKFQKQMVVEPKEKTADVVTLENTKDPAAPLRLIQFARIQPPLAGRWSYPAIPAGGINEEEVFERAPEQWDNPELVPKAPIEHHDRKLLEQLIPPAQAAYVTLPYVEMPDGRVIYYYEPEKRPLMRVIPGSDWEKQGAPQALSQPTAPDAGAEQVPEMPPEGLPPGMNPDGLVPPEDMEPMPDPGARRRR